MRTRSLFLPILALVALAACSSPAAAPSAAALTTAAPTTAAPTQAATTSPDASSPATGSVTAMVVDSAHGKILVDGAGMTLYGFTPDDAGTPTCYDACAQNWPPLLASGEITVGEGLDDSDFTTVPRTDGGNQVKVGTWPLYYFVGDAAPGDTNGQGLQGIWYVVSPTGDLIK